MEDIELEKLFELFDKALTSKDERVVNALRSLLMIAALTDTHESDPVHGPLTQLLKQLKLMENRLSSLEYDQHTRGSYGPGGGNGTGYPWTSPQIGPWTTSGTGPTWTANPASSSYTYASPTLNTGAVSGTLDTSYKLSLSNVELEEILKDYK